MWRGGWQPAARRARPISRLFVARRTVFDYRCDELGRGRDGEGREVAARSCLRRTELP